VKKYQSLAHRTSYELLKRKVKNENGRQQVHIYFSGNAEGFAHGHHQRANQHIFDGQIVGAQQLENN
jgi:hypothetical protein